MSNEDHDDSDAARTVEELRATKLRLEILRRTIDIGLIILGIVGASRFVGIA